MPQGYSLIKKGDLLMQQMAGMQINFDETATKSDN